MIFYGEVASKWTENNYFSSTHPLILRKQLSPAPTTEAALLPTP